jgi:hypothetical protein
MFDILINGACRAVVAAALAALPIGASAATVDIFGSTFGSGASRTFTGLLGDIDATFTAHGGNFQTKTVRGWTAVGVSGKTRGEIDIGESIVGTFSSAVYVPYLTLAFLFDGPEFNDVQERASISATLADGSNVSYSLTALFRGDYDYTGPSFVDNLSRPTRNNAGVWDIEDPFDGAAIRSFTLTALIGECGRGSCTNQSDFAFHSLGIERVAEIPEPGALALLLSGLATIGLVTRRRLRAR